MNTWRALARGLLWVVLAWAVSAGGAQIPVPPLTGHVVDQTQTLTTGQREAIETRLAEFEQRKGSQVVVLVVRTTAPETIEAFALRVAEQWKPGRKKVDDGVILLVALDDRAVRLEVGYGLEGTLNDATCKRLIDEFILPHFKGQDFAGGIDAGIQRVLQVIDGEPLPTGKSAARTASDDVQYLTYSVLMLFAVVMGALLTALLGRAMGSLLTGGLVAVMAWVLLGAVSLALVAGMMTGVFIFLGGIRFLWAFYGGRGSGGYRGGGGGFGGGGSTGRW